jgi:hypothetical protein
VCENVDRQAEAQEVWWREVAFNQAGKDDERAIDLRGK